MIRHRQPIAARRSQRGVTLVVGMIMLVLITLVVLASFHLGRNNLDIVGNAQHRNDAIAAAQQTIEAAVNSPLLTSSPGAIFTAPCQGDNTLCYDINGDGKNDVVAKITPTPTCVRSQIIPLTNLNLADPRDQVCTVGVNQGSFGQGGGSSDSNCANSVWDIRAVAQDLGPDGVTLANQGATAVVNQGIAKRVGKNEIATSCP